MSNLGFNDAFAKYGAKLKNPQWAVSSIAKDGSLVMSCWSHYMKKHDDVMRYQDRLSRWSGNAAGNNLLREHLSTAAQDGLPIKVVIASTKEREQVDGGHDASAVEKKFHVRLDWVGKLVKFDGDEMIIDFRQCKG
jgi:hypothetical protein